ncbi:MAG: thioredoxin family protein [Candidatus Micrarchaeota archaeon]|nr:thioredoxin family protein [Candidatus Micrarchaeota archaeon]
MLEVSSEAELSKQISKGKSLVLFYASWCPDCKRFMPIFEALSPGGKIRLLKAQIDDESNSIWDSFNISVVPTVVLFENGKEKGRAQETSPGQCARQLNKLLR